MSKQIQSRLPLTYITIRKIIGTLAMSLPIIIFLVEKGIFQESLKTSISAYYYTDMRWFFILTLCCIGFFLFFYQGYDNFDKWLTGVAGVAAFLTALFPTGPSDGNVCMSPLVIFSKGGEASLVVGSFICSITEKIHLTSAVTMFGVVAVLSWFQFTKGESNTNEKKIRNRIYKTCSIIIILAIVAIGLSFVIGSKAPEPLRTWISFATYWGEFIALFAFGFTWAVKGEALWNDVARSNNSKRFNELQNLQYQGYKSGLSFYVFLVALWLTVVLFAAGVPPFDFFDEGGKNKAASMPASAFAAEEDDTQVSETPSSETRSLGFYKSDAQNILTGILFILVVVAIYSILNNQILPLFWPLVRRNFRADMGNDINGEKEALWSLFSNQVNEMGVQSRFSINPKADTAITAPPALTPESSYLKTFFDLLGWIFPQTGYSLRLNKVSSKYSGTGLSLAVVRNDRKENIAEKTFWAEEFGIDEVKEEKNEDQGKDLRVQKYLMIPAYFWFADVVDRMDGFEPEEHAWQSMAYYHLGNLLWHSDLDVGIDFYGNSINFDQKNWAAYAPLGRIWIEKSQEQRDKAIAIENLLLANSYLETAIDGLDGQNTRDRVYFGALYNQIVALNYLFNLGWKKDFNLKKLILEGYKVKEITLLTLSNIQEELIQRKQISFFSNPVTRHTVQEHRGGNRAENIENEIKRVKQHCEQLSSRIKTKIIKDETNPGKEARHKVTEQELRTHSTTGYVIQLLPAFEFALQGLELQDSGYTFHKANEALEQIARLPCFEKPIDMDHPLKPDDKSGYHFIRSHYRVQYNTACFYSQLASMSSKKDEQGFFVDLAIDHLVMALSGGGGLVEFAQNDSDLNAIRSHPRYKEIIKPKKKPGKNKQKDNNNLSVYRNPDGKWVYKSHGSKRTSSVYKTQAEAIAEAKKALHEKGGGELIVHGEDGKIRQKDTIAPGNDPHNLKG